MANFSSFFPVAAAGGGGFTKMNKYSTFRALNDTTQHIGPTVNVNLNAGTAGSSTVVGDQSGTDTTVLNPENAYVGYTFSIGGTTHTVTASTANNGWGWDLTFTITPTVVSNFSAFSTTFTTPGNITVNPATDLGLSDGDSLGYFMVGAGEGSTSTLGNGGYILQGTSIISTASTNLVLTPASAATSGTSRVHSTISGGLTLTTADGYNSAGASDATGYSTFGFGYGNGINGYGAGGKYASGISQNNFPYSHQSHGFGNGGTFLNSNFLTGSDGAILLFY